MKKVSRMICALFTMPIISIASETIHPNSALINNQSNNNSIEYYSSMSHLHQNIKPVQGLVNDDKKIKVIRDVNENIISMEWISNNISNKVMKRDFAYDKNNLLREITYKENETIKEITIMGENEIGKVFFTYIFSPGFSPRKYNYYTKTTLKNKLPIKHEIISMNNQPIGIISKKYDENNNLIRETWHRGKSNVIIRDFTIKFNHQSKHYELMEVDKNGNVINNQIASIK